MTCTISTLSRISSIISFGIRFDHQVLLSVGPILNKIILKGYKKSPLKRLKGFFCDFTHDRHVCVSLKFCFNLAITFPMSFKDLAPMDSITERTFLTLFPRRIAVQVDNPQLFLARFPLQMLNRSSKRQVLRHRILTLFRQSVKYHDCLRVS